MVLWSNSLVWALPGTFGSTNWVLISQCSSQWTSVHRKKNTASFSPLLGTDTDNPQNNEFLYHMSRQRSQPFSTLPSYSTKGFQIIFLEQYRYQLNRNATLIVICSISEVLNSIGLKVLWYIKTEQVGKWGTVHRDSVLLIFRFHYFLMKGLDLYFLYGFCNRKSLDLQS